MLSKNISQKIFLRVLFVDLKFCKNLGLSQVSIVNEATVQLAGHL
jgi:hypothetical protein